MRTFSVGQRSKHSLVTDTCTGCHMVLSPPPAEFSRNLAGTNHEFEASMAICGDCHGEHGLTLRVDTCATCHGTTDVETIRMSDVDYDGDGDTEEGIAEEVNTMRDAVYAAMQAYATNVVGTGMVRP